MVPIHSEVNRLGHRVRRGPRRRFLAGERPDDPSFRFLVHWALRSDELCDSGLCPDAPEEDGHPRPLPPRPVRRGSMRGERTAHLIRRALDLMSALKLAVHFSLDDIRGDEFCAMLIVAEERDVPEREKLPGAGGRHNR